MSSGEPLDPQLAAALEDAMTIWASPALIEDHERRDIGPIALLTMTPSITVHTGDDHPGAELVDVVASSLLRWGFGLVTALEPSELVELPLLPTWRATFVASGNALQILEPGGVFYDGDLGDGLPAGWHEALRERGSLIVLVGSALALDVADRFDQITAASRAGRIVGAQLPLT